MRIMKKIVSEIKRNKWAIITGALCFILADELRKANDLNEMLRTKNQDLDSLYNELRREQFRTDLDEEGVKMRLREICRKYGIMESVIEKNLSTEEYAEISKALGFAHDPGAESWVKNIHS